MVQRRPEDSHPETLRTAVRGLGAPVASVGGAGNFDGIFLTGILAVLLARAFTRGQARRMQDSP